MKNSEKVNRVRELNARLRDEQAKGSTGAVGKLMDFCVRDYLMAHGVDRADDVRCRSAVKSDWTIRIGGKLYRGETKTNMGEWKVPFARINADDIFPTCAYVVYTAEVEGLDMENFMDNMFVFTREQFIELLTETGRKGLESSLRYNQSRGTVGIQAWKTYNKKSGKWCEARLSKYYEFLEVNEIPTLSEFREMVRG